MVGREGNKAQNTILMMVTDASAKPASWDRGILPSGIDDGVFPYSLEITRVQQS